MVESADNLKTCPVCDKKFPPAVFRLHEVQCARLNYKCEKCGMVLLKADREQHELDHHTEKPKVEVKPESPKPVVPIENSAFESTPALNQNIGSGNPMPQTFDDGMDENEREIARIMAEEAELLNGGGGVSQPQTHMPSASAGFPEDMLDEDGRRPDEMVTQQMIGGDEDIDESEMSEAMENLRNEAMMGVGMGRGMRMGGGFQQPPVYEPMPKMTPQMEEDADMARAMAESMGVPQTDFQQPASIPQANFPPANFPPSQFQHDMPQPDSIHDSGFPDANPGISVPMTQAEEDAELARVLAMSQDQQ